MPFQSLSLCVDLYGCPNRCRHCWLGHMPNRTMAPDADARIVERFKPYFERIAFYSWLRPSRSTPSRSASSWRASGGWSGTRTTPPF